MGIGLAAAHSLIEVGGFGLLGSAVTSAITNAVTSVLGPMLNVGSIGVTCASRDAARSRINAKIKAWRYRYFAEWSNQLLTPGAGAYHGVEVPLIFGSGQFYTNISDEPEEIALSKNMRHAWAEFARDPQNGLSKLGWPVYDEQSKSDIPKMGVRG
jgi:carboxylesterase type B